MTDTVKRNEMAPLNEFRRLLAYQLAQSSNSLAEILLEKKREEKVRKKFVFNCYTTDEKTADKILTAFFFGHWRLIIIIMISRDYVPKRRND